MTVVAQADKPWRDMTPAERAAYLAGGLYVAMPYHDGAGYGVLACARCRHQEEYAPVAWSNRPGDPCPRCAGRINPEEGEAP